MKELDIEGLKKDIKLHLKHSKYQTNELLNYVEGESFKVFSNDLHKTKESKEVFLKEINSHLTQKIIELQDIQVENEIEEEIAKLTFKSETDRKYAYQEIKVRKLTELLEVRNAMINIFEN